MGGKKSKLYQVVFFPWWQYPDIAPNYLWNFIKRPVLGEQEGERNKIFVPSQPPRSHLIFYNPFNSQGRGKEKREEVGKAEKETKRLEIMFPLHYNPHG